MKIRLADGSGFSELRHLVEDVDRHGNVRVYYRRRGRPKVRLHAPFGSDEFIAQYREVHAGVAQQPPAADVSRRGPAKLGSLRWLIEQYYGSAEFRGLEDSTQHARRLILDALCEEPLNTNDFRSPGMGTARYSLMEPKHVRKCRDRKAEWPESANGRVKALRQVFAWAIEAGHAKSNPAKDVPYLKGAGTGFHTWTIEEFGNTNSAIRLAVRPDSRWPYSSLPDSAVPISSCSASNMSAKLRTFLRTCGRFTAGAGSPSPSAKTRNASPFH